MAAPSGPLPFAVLGPGILMLTRTDVAAQTPINVGYAQEFSIDMSATNKELFGQNKFPLVVGQTTIKASGKIKAAEINGLAWSTAFFGTSLTSLTGVSWFIEEAHTPSGTTQQVTNHTSGIVDLGVKYAGTGVPLQRVAPASEAQGKYSVAISTGTYTFDATDEVPLLFTYTNANATGSTLGIVNTPIGQTPTFAIDYYTNLNQPGAAPLAIHVYAAVGTKLTTAFKLEDYMMPEIDFGFFALSNGKVIDYYLPNSPN